MSETRPVRPAIRTLIVALAAFVTLGLVDGALGVAWPSMRATFDRGLSDLGLLLFFGSTGYLLASIGYGWLHSVLGTGTLLGGGSVSMVVGVVGIAGAPAWGLVAMAAILLGLGGGLVDTGMNAHAALVFDVGSINLLHAWTGSGPVSVPSSSLSVSSRRGLGAPATRRWQSSRSWLLWPFGRGEAAGPGPSPT